VIRVVVDPGVFVSALIGTRGAAPDLVGDRLTPAELADRMRAG
jgi:predicted nucleic acid-binding protein